MINSFKCSFHLIYYADCKTFSNIYVLKYYCKVIQAQHTIPYNIKYYHKNLELNRSHGDVSLEIHNLNELFEDHYQNRYDLFMFIPHGLPLTTPLLSRGILQRQYKVRNNSDLQSLFLFTLLLPRRILKRHNKIKDLSSIHRYNYNDLSFVLYISLIFKSMYHF